MTAKGWAALNRATTIALLAAGTLTLLVFIGAPNHSRLLFSDAQQAVVEQSCPTGSLLCRGFHSLSPVVQQSFSSAAPFASYAFACFLVAVVFLLMRWRFPKAPARQVHMRPAHLLLTFVTLVWVLFTSITLQSNARLIPEPSAQSLPNVSNETLAALQESFGGLEANSCLGSARTSDQGVRYRELKFSCAQSAFAFRILPQLLVFVVFLLEILILGRFLLSLLRAPPNSRINELVFAAGLGACGWIVLLWTLGNVSLLNGAIVWSLVILVPIAAHRHLFYWLRFGIQQSFELDVRRSLLLTILAWILLSTLAFNFLHVIRPIPLGFDDLNSYLMRPRAMAALGSSIYSTSTFQWEYLTALGFVLFGIDSVFGATTAMMINWSAGALAILGIIAFGSMFANDSLEVERKGIHFAGALGTGGLLAACLYYLLPLVNHFSYADMKVDNAVFFFGCLATLALFLYLFRSDAVSGSAEPSERQPLDESDAENRKYAPPKGSSTFSLALAGIFVGFAVALKFTAVMVIAGVVVVLAMVSWLDSKSIRAASKAAAIFLTSAAIGIVPWIVVNVFRYQEALPLPVSTAPKIHDVRFEIPGINSDAEIPSTRTLPPDIDIDTSHPNCQLTDRIEELDRYWGPDRGVDRYSTLPWRTLMNLDVGGYYVTMIPAIGLVPFVLLLTTFWSRRQRWARWLAAFTTILLVLWLFIGNGVPWYGIGALLGLMLGLEYLVFAGEPKLPRMVAGTFVLISIALALSMRLQRFEDERVMLDYALGKQSARALQETLAPNYSTVREMVLQRAADMPERPFLYQVGTFIPYFLADVPHHIGIADNQLGFFYCLYQEGNASLTSRRLRALGFNSMIFDRGTASIEADPNGTLHHKVAAFVEFANDRSADIRAVINDPNGGVAYLLLP